MPPKGRGRASAAVVQDDEPEVDEKTGLRLWRKVHLRIKFEADLKPYVAPPPPEPSSEPEPVLDVKAGKKGAAVKGKGGAAGKGAPLAGEPGLPSRSLSLSWAMLSGSMYKWAVWPAEPTADGAVPLTVDADPNSIACNPELPPEGVLSTFKGSLKDGGTYSLSCTQPLKSNEALVNAMMDSNAFMEVQLSQKTGAVAGLAEESIAEGALQLDVSDLLLQEKAVFKEWRDNGDACTGSKLPKELAKEYSRVAMSLEVWSVAVVPPQPPAPNAKRAPAPVQPATPIEAVPAEPVSLLTPDLVAMLNPLVLRPLSVRDLPDFPATREQIDNACYPMTLKYFFPEPKPARANVHEGIPTAWRIPADSDLLDEPSTRDCYFTSRDIVLLGNCDIDALTQQCREAPLELRVLDRSALPEEPEFKLKNVPPEFRKPPYWNPSDEERAEEEARKAAAAKKTGDGATGDDGELETAAEPPVFDDDDDGEVFGLAKLSLADLVKGYTRIETDIQVQPGTTIRGAAGLEWHTRPGRYLQAGSELTVCVRTAIPIPEMKGKDYRPRNFNRIIFLMDYKDVELFLRIERAVKACNIVTLDLLPQPSEDATSKAEQSQNGSREGRAPLTAEASLATGVSGKTPPGSSQPRAATTTPQSKKSSATPPGSAPKSATPGLEHGTSVGEGVVEGAEGDDGPKIPDPPPPPPHGHLQELEVSLYVQQQLSTYKLSDQERIDPNCDVITGCHVIDSKWRMIILEGLHWGAMSLISAIAGWALKNRTPVEGGRPRKILYNAKFRYPHRLFCSLGVNLWIIKLRAPLPKIFASPSSWAQGMVREQCKEGIRRLHMLTQATYMRQVDENNWMPTDMHLGLVDKKFGGELTREDVLGYSRKSKRKPRHGSMSQAIHAVQSVSSSGTETARKKTWKAPTEHTNARYLSAKADAASRRANTDWNADYADMLAELTRTMQPLRDGWASWNPYRTAAKELEEMVRSGAMTLQETEVARGAKERPPIPGTIDKDESAKLGWYPHDKPFLWPYPQDPSAFNNHPKQPSGARVEELGYPWVEGEMHRPVGLRPVNAGGKFFQTIFGGEDKELFGKDPEYWKTVFISGDSLEAELAEDKQREREEWEKKVVVDDVMFRAILHSRAAGQLDRRETMLKDPPAKKSLKQSYVPPMPISMFAEEEPFDEDVSTSKPTVHTTQVDKWTNREKSFQTCIPRDKSQVHRPGHSQAWGA